MKVVEKIIKVKLDEEEKLTLLKRVEPFTEGGLCECVNCEAITCSPDCPIYRLDEQAKALRNAVIDFIDGAE